MSLLLSLPAILIAITIHEYAHAYAAYRMGDPTAKMAGRLTLNPLKHIDIMGFIALLIARIGWAKPVPINPFYFKNPRRDEALVSLAGPLANLLLAIGFGLVIRVQNQVAILDTFLGSLLFMIYLYNVVLCAFNLLPVPPLDGSRILFAVLPRRFRHHLMSFEQFGPFVIFGLIILDRATNANVLWGYIGLVLRLVNSLVIGTNFPI